LALLAPKNGESDVSPMTLEMAKIVKPLSFSELLD
jgi:hypothetical protein